MKLIMKTTSKSQILFFPYIDVLVQVLIVEGRVGTAQSYIKAKSSFLCFLKESDNMEEESVKIESIDSFMIGRYNGYLLSRGLVRNSISFYNRVLRSIYNKAVKQYHLVDKRPFDQVYTGVDKTVNRAIRESTIAKLLVLNLSYDKTLEMVRDLFVFSYAARGMAFVDIAYLRKANIHGKYITYCRKKTGTRLEIRIEDQIDKLIKKYTNPNSQYVFPILEGASSDDEQEVYRHYQSKLASFNRKLKTLASMVDEPLKLTTYVARHSWATAARNTNIPMSIISEGLGHKSERTTRIYLASFDESLIDEANVKLLKRIGYLFVSMKETNNGLVD